MAAARVAPALDEGEDGDAGAGLGLEPPPLRERAFERGEEALAHRVVVGAGLSGPSRARRSPPRHAGSERRRRAPRPLVRAMDHALGPALAEGHAEGVEHELGSEVPAHRPAHHPPREGVHDDREEQKARPGRDAGDVGDPRPVGRIEVDVAIHVVAGGPGALGADRGPGAAPQASRRRSRRLASAARPACARRARPSRAAGAMRRRVDRADRGRPPSVRHGAGRRGTITPGAARGSRETPSAALVVATGERAWFAVVSSKTSRTSRASSEPGRGLARPPATVPLTLREDVALHPAHRRTSRRRRHRSSRSAPVGARRERGRGTHPARPRPGRPSIDHGWSAGPGLEAQTPTSRDSACTLRPARCSATIRARNSGGWAGLVPGFSEHSFVRQRAPVRAGELQSSARRLPCRPSSTVGGAGGLARGAAPCVETSRCLGPVWAAHRAVGGWRGR